MTSARSSVSSAGCSCRRTRSGTCWVIQARDYYRPAHQVIHEAILGLYERGEPPGPVPVSNELVKRGEITQVGGAPYLHTLIASVPTAANAGYYARIVRERAILRRLIEAGTRIVPARVRGRGERGRHRGPGAQGNRGCCHVSGPG